MVPPRCLYNCDEIFPLDGMREKAVTMKKAKYAYTQAHGTSEHITGASAARIALPL